MKVWTEEKDREILEKLIELKRDSDPRSSMAASLKSLETTR